MKYLNYFCIKVERFVMKISVLSLYIYIISFVINYILCKLYNVPDRFPQIHTIIHHSFMFDALFAQNTTNTDKRKAAEGFPGKLQ